MMNKIKYNVKHTLFAMLFIFTLLLTGCQTDDAETAQAQLRNSEATLLEAIAYYEQIEEVAADENWWSLQQERHHAQVVVENIAAEMDRYIRALDLEDIFHFEFSEDQYLVWQNQMDAAMASLDEAFDYFIANENHWVAEVAYFEALEAAVIPDEFIAPVATDPGLVMTFESYLDISPTSVLVVANVDELRAAIIAAPTDGTLTEIQLDFTQSDGRAYNDEAAIEITDGRHILIRSVDEASEMQMLVQRFGVSLALSSDHAAGRHFIVDGEETLLVLEDVILNGDSAHFPIVTTLTGQRGGVWVRNDATFTMDGAIIEETRSFGHPVSAGAVHVSSGNFNLESGYIRYNLSAQTNNNGGPGAGVHIASNGHFIMNDGQIHHNQSGTTTSGGSGGGGVAITGDTGTFIMNGGEIAYNIAGASGQGGGGGMLVTGSHANVSINEQARIHHNRTYGQAGQIAHGGGIHFNSGSHGTFTLNGGQIDHNELISHNGQGGGIRLSGGTFTMYDGVIDHNVARARNATPFTNTSVSGGGVAFWLGGGNHYTFHMYGGQIAHNISHAGGGGGGILSNSPVGAAVYSTIYIGENAQINYNQCLSTVDNLLWNGGGMALRGSRLDVTLAGRVHGNSSRIWAGGIHIGQSGVSTNDQYVAHRFRMLPTAEITNNVAGWDGGGIVFSAGQDETGVESYVIYGGLIAYNYTINPIGSGGGILMPWTANGTQSAPNAVVSVPLVTIHGGTFRENGISRDPLQTGGRPARNSEGRVLTRDGGAIYTQSPHDVIRRRRLTGQITPTQNRHARPAPYGVIISGRYPTEFIGNEVIYNGGAIFSRPFQQDMTAPVRIPGEEGQLINIATSQRVLTPWLPYIGPDSDARWANNWASPSEPPATTYYALPYYALYIDASVVFSNNVAHRGPAFPPVNPEVTAIETSTSGNSVYPVHAGVFSPSDHLLNNYDINFWTSGELEKEVSVEQANVGERITYTITVRNTTPFVSLEQIQVVDPIDITRLNVATGSIAITFMDGEPMANATYEFNPETGVLEVDVAALYRPEWWDDLIMPYFIITFDAYILPSAACGEIDNAAFLFISDRMRDFDGAAVVEIECDLPEVTLEFLKVDYDDQLPLAGAVFHLYRRNHDDTAWLTPAIGSVTTGHDGIARFTGLRHGGTYRLVEVLAPDGFATPTGYWIVTVSQDGVITITSSDDDQPTFTTNQ